MLEGAACDVEIRNYLEVPPKAEELKTLLSLLGCKALDLIRKDEPLYKALKVKNITEAAAIKLMIKHPILIQRPIVIDGDKAVIGRPPELVLDLLKRKTAKQKPSLLAKQKFPQTK